MKAVASDRIEEGAYANPSAGGLAGTGARTPDLLITNQLLYQLSYTGSYFSASYNLRSKGNVAIV